MPPSPLEKDLQEIQHYYQQLLLTTDAISARHTEHTNEKLDPALADGLAQLRDFVGNLLIPLQHKITHPGTDGLPLLEPRTVRTKEVFAKVNAILDAFKDDRILDISYANTMSMLLEDKLLEAYVTIDALRGPDAQASSIQSSGRIHASPAKTPGGRDGQG